MVFAKFIIMIFMPNVKIATPFKLVNTYLTK